jgi:hypothetical protein
MKLKLFLIVIICSLSTLISSGQAAKRIQAESRLSKQSPTSLMDNSMKERTETWLNSNASDAKGENRAGDEEPSDEPSVGSIGNALTTLLICTGIYAIVIARQTFNKGIDRHSQLICS